MSQPRSRTASAASRASTGSRPSVHAERGPVPPVLASSAPSSATWRRHDPWDGPPSVPLPPIPPPAHSRPRPSLTAGSSAHLSASVPSASSETFGPSLSPYWASPAPSLPQSSPQLAPSPASAGSPSRVLISPERGLFSRSTGSLASNCSSLSSSPTPLLMPPSPYTPGVPATPPPASPARQPPVTRAKDHPFPLRSSASLSPGFLNSPRSSTDGPAPGWQPEWNTRAAWSGSTHPAQPLDPPERQQTLRPAPINAPERSTTITPARPSPPPGVQGQTSEQTRSTLLLAHSPEPMLTSLGPSQSRSGQVPLGDELAWLINAYASERGSTVSTDHGVRPAQPAPTRLQPSLSPVPSYRRSEAPSSPRMGNRDSALDRDLHGAQRPSWVQFDDHELRDGPGDRLSPVQDSVLEGNAEFLAASSPEAEEDESFYDVDLHDDQDVFSAEPNLVRVISHTSSGSTSLHPGLHRLARHPSGSDRHMSADAVGEEDGEDVQLEEDRHESHDRKGHHASHAPSTTEFDHVHGSYAGPYIPPLEPGTPLSWHHLIRKPVIRQWLYDGKYYGEVHERTVSRSELVFDMAAAGVCHILASEAAEASNGAGIAKFAIVFYLSYSIWADMRSWINQSGSDDVIQRLVVLVYMIVMAGFAANATAVNIVYADTDGCRDETPVNKDLSRRWPGQDGKVYRRAIGSGSANSGVASGLGSCADVTAHIFGGYFFATGYRSSLHAATAFYVWAKGIRLALLVLYGWRLRSFRRALWVQAACLAVLAGIFLSILAAESSGTVIALTITGLFTDWVLRYAVSAVTQWMHGHIKRTSRPGYSSKPGHLPTSLGLGHVPAINVEHMSERMTLFCLVSIGEVVISSMFTASSNPQDKEMGFSNLWGASALAITLAFLISWLTFDAHGSRTYVHALRRGPLVSLAYTSIYFPLCGAIVLLGSAVERLLDQSRVHPDATGSSVNDLSDELTSRHASSLGWLLSGSVAVVLACLAIIGCLHKSLDVPHTALVCTRVRITVRALAAVLAALVPLITNHLGGKLAPTLGGQASSSAAQDLAPRHGLDPVFQPTSQELQAETHPLPLLGMQAALLVVLVAFETTSKIGSVGKTYDSHRAAVRHHERMQARARARRTPNIRAGLPGLGPSARQDLQDGYSRPSVAGGFVPLPRASARPSIADALRPSFHTLRPSTSSLPSLPRPSAESQLLGLEGMAGDEKGPEPPRSGLTRLLSPLTPTTSTTRLLPPTTPAPDWHEYSHLSPAEQGSPDASAQNIGHVHPHTLRTSMRWALLAH